MINEYSAFHYTQLAATLSAAETVCIAIFLPPQKKLGTYMELKHFDIKHIFRFSARFYISLKAFQFIIMDIVNQIADTDEEEAASVKVTTRKKSRKPKKQNAI